jgi:hypothetical protein
LNLRAGGFSPLRRQRSFFHRPARFPYDPDFGPTRIVIDFFMFRLSSMKMNS